MTPAVSIVVPTYRPGGIDLLAMSLAPQRPVYELIVVDGCPGRPERGIAERHLRNRGVNVGWYGPPRPKAVPQICNLANAMNTGAIHSRASRIVFVHDFTYFHPDAVDRWLNSFEENGTRAVVVGIADVRESDPPDAVGDVSVWGSPNPLAKVLPGRQSLWIPETFENCNFSVTAAYMEGCNGVDSRADDYIPWTVSSIEAQAHLNDYRIVVDRRCCVTMIDHRTWSDDGSGLWNIKHMAASPGYPEPGWQRWSQNDYCLRDERRKYLEGAR